MISVKCNMCKKSYPLDVTSEQYSKWQRGALIQDVMPDLTSAERELLISNTCEKCFDEMFPPDLGEEL